MSMSDWAKREIEIACKREKDNAEDKESELSLDNGEYGCKIRRGEVDGWNRDIE